MTTNDLRLIRRANDLRRWDYESIRAMIPKADTQQCRDRLVTIYWELRDLCLESV